MDLPYILVLKPNFFGQNLGEKVCGGSAYERVIGDFCMDIEYRCCYCRLSMSFSTFYKIRLLYQKL